MQGDELHFDLSVKEIPATIGGNRYKLREASEDAATKYRNHMLRATRFSDGKITGVDGMADAEALLVSLCLFESIKDNQGNAVGERPVPLVTVRSWPARVVKPLFEKCREISDLEEKPKDLPGKIASLRAELASLEKQQAEEDRAKN